jgi:hypothetical protein
MHTLIRTYPTPMEDSASLEGKFLQLSAYSGEDEHRFRRNVNT